MRGPAVASQQPRTWGISEDLTPPQWTSRVRSQVRPGPRPRAGPRAAFASPRAMTVTSHHATPRQPDTRYCCGLPGLGAGNGRQEVQPANRRRSSCGRRRAAPDRGAPSRAQPRLWPGDGEAGLSLEGVARQSFRKWGVWENIATRAILRSEWAARTERDERHGNVTPTERRSVDLAALADRARTGPCFVCAHVAGDSAYHHEPVYEDPGVVAFLSRDPTLRGYRIVAPRRHDRARHGRAVQGGIRRAPLGDLRHRRNPEAGAARGPYGVDAVQRRRGRWSGRSLGRQIL